MKVSKWFLTLFMIGGMTVPAVAKTHYGRYWLFIDSIEPAAGEPSRMLLWVALPPDHPGQKVQITGYDPMPTEIIEVSAGNRIAFWKLPLTAGDHPMSISYDLKVKSRPVSLKLKPDKIQPWDRESTEYLRFTRSEPWIELTPEIRTTAAHIVGEEINPLIQAKKVFDWVLASMMYEYPDISKRGVENSFYSKKGDCGEFSVVFVALCRSLGIPARTVTCVWFHGSGHQWAEILLPPYGWVPVDTSVAQMFVPGNSTLPENEKASFLKMVGMKKATPDDFFGQLYPNRLIVSVGNNLEVVSKSTGEQRIFRFIQPGAGAAFPPAIEFSGLQSSPAHAGFYVFGKGAKDRESAWKRAQKEMASMHLQAGRMEKAEAGLLLAVKDNPMNAEAWLNLGQIYLGTNDLDSAEAAFLKSLEGRSGSVTPIIHVWAHNLLGNVLDLKGKRAEAIEQYQKAIESGVDHSGAQEYATKYLETSFSL